MKDEDIIKVFISAKSGRQISRLSKSNIKKYPNEYSYLLNRFSDSESPQESLYRIINKIEKRPVCPICGGYIKFGGGAVSGGFHSSCGNKKCRQENYENKLEARTGCRNSFQLEKTKKKCKETWLEKYGVDNPSKSKEIQDKIDKTCKERYGCRFKTHFETNPFTWPSVKEKIKRTMLERYGVKSWVSFDYYKENKLNPFYKPEIQEKCRQTRLEKRGVEYYSQTDEWKALWKDPEFVKNKLEKEYQTRKENHSYGPNSKQEAEIFEKLKTKWPKTENQHYDKELYPFRCDFYIPEIDTWIEYQGFYTHGDHPFDPQSEEDNKHLKYLYDKGYELAIKTWTYTDPLKRATAEANNLKYLEFFTVEEFDNWFKQQNGEA